VTPRAASSGQNDRMSRQERGGGRGEVARGAGYAAFLGAALIGVAVIIGIVLLQIGDRDDTGPTASGPTAKTTTTTTKPSTTGSTPGTTDSTAPPRSPSQVHLIVLNGGAASGEAAHTASGLKLAGYTSQEDANTWTDHEQAGNTVYCRAGLQREGTALATGVTGLNPGGPSVKFSIPYPTPAPPFTDGTDCVVVVGS
jgi:LytR cell envelope-related transcriptional attenuator